MTQEPTVRFADLDMRESAMGSRFAARAGRIGGLLGLSRLGAQYMEVPAGKTAYPRHNHRNNEEMFVILEGEGTYRRGDEAWSVRKGDVISAPAGDASTAHQLVNSSNADLKYLSISTRNDPDICEYPDSGKYAVAAGVPAGGGMLSADFSLIGRERESLDYWDGEDTGEEQ